MTQKTINLGTADQGNGDPIRVAFGKVNDNFTELYTALGLVVDANLNLGAFEFAGSTLSTTDSSAIVIDQATTITSNLSVGGDIVPQTALGGDLGSSTLPWRSLYVSNNTIYIGGTAVGVDANGNLTTGGTVVGSTPAWANITGKPTFATVSTTGAYADLTGKPTIPTLVSQLANDSGFLTSVGNISNIQSEGNINIEINLSDSTLRRWQFGEDGDTVFPNNVSINYSGGNIQFPRIIADSGKAFSVQGQGTSGSAALSWTVNPDAAGQYAAVAVSKGGGDNLAKVILQAQSDSGDAGTAKIWKFDETGILSLPSNGKIASGVSTAQVGSTTTIALNDQGTDQASNITSLGIAWTGNEAVFTTYAAGSTITFANGDVRTINDIQKNEVYDSPGEFVIDIYWSASRANLTAFPITLKTSNYAAAYTAPEWQFGTNGSLTFPNGTTQTTAPESFSFNVAGDDSTQRAISNNELIKFIGAGGITTASDAEGNITITGSGGGTSIPTVVTTGAAGEGGASHAKVQFTVASATTVTAVGVTVIGVTVPAKGKITLSGSPATGSFDIVAVTNTFPGEFFICMPFATNASGTGYGAPILGEGTNPCLVRGTMITMADMSRVAVENITYNDDILVWDFDLGEFASAKPIWIKKTQTAVVSCLLTFSDHSELRIVGESPKAHRIFNKEAGKFTYGSMPETPIGTTTFNDQGEEITLVSKEWIVGEVEFYNVMTDYHMNLFANSILTSMRYNNVYPITDMKFVKDSRTLRTSDDYPNVEERLYKGFRLAEQTQSIEEIETHIQWLLALEVERETECV
jgi:hypothetical protein